MKLTQIYFIVIILQIVLSKKFKQEKVQAENDQNKSNDDFQKKYLQLKTNVKSLEQQTVNLLTWSKSVLDRSLDFMQIRQSQDYLDFKSSLEKTSKLNKEVKNKIQKALNSNNLFLSVNKQQQLSNELKNLSHELSIQSYSAQYLEDILQLRENGVQKESQSKVKFFHNKFEGAPTPKW